MVDYSFIRLSTTLQKALTLGDSPVSTIHVSDFIQLLPNEVYLQITNTPNGIAFDGNYQVLVTDCNGTQLSDITSNVAIEQFTDNNGLPQIKFELSNLGVDFYKRPVLLKFIHTVSNAFWYSNPICITEYGKENTTRFDYRSYKDFYGTAYNIADCYQSIRLACYFDLPDAESSSEEYTQIDGNKVVSRLIQTDYHKFVFDKIDAFTYQRLNKLLTNTVIYVNGVRMTDKVVSQSGDRQGDTNWFSLDFKVAINYNEQFTPQFQIFTPLTLESLFPVDNESYTVDIATPFTATFNNDIEITDSSLLAYLYRNGVLVESVTPTVLDNVLTVPFTYTFDVADYYILVDSDKIQSAVGELWGGIALSSEWNFTIEEGAYESSSYSNDYLI